MLTKRSITVIKECIRNAEIVWLVVEENADVENEVLADDPIVEVLWAAVLAMDALVVLCGAAVLADDPIVDVDADVLPPAVLVTAIVIWKYWIKIFKIYLTNVKYIDTFSRMAIEVLHCNNARSLFYRRIAGHAAANARAIVEAHSRSSN